MIPMADNFNHSDMSIINETINLDMQKKYDKKSKYFTKDKFMNNYLGAFSEEDAKIYTESIVGRLNK